VPARTSTTQDLDLEALIASPEETGYYECAVPDEYALEPDQTRATPQPLEAACSRRFRAIRNSGVRSLSQIGLVIIHCTQSNSARSSAEWFANPNTQGSAHLVLDEDECYRTLVDSAIPWAAPGANTRGFHIELAGFAEWSRAEWMRHRRGLRRAAHKAAAHAVKFGVPIRLLTPAQMRNGARGFATHARCTTAFGGSHTDPGPNYPIDRFMRWTREFAEEISK
jgi:N-acetylmuramoyl-L-alanine amidase